MTQIRLTRDSQRGWQQPAHMVTISSNYMNDPWKVGHRFAALYKFHMTFCVYSSGSHCLSLDNWHFLSHGDRISEICF